VKTNIQTAAVIENVCEIPLKRANPPAAAKPTRVIPSWLKWGFTAFMAALVPVYWTKYGPTNFLYFCDIALFLTLASVWTEKAIFASMAAVGIIAVQAIWCLDFGAHFAGVKLLGMTDYMFDAHRPIYLRALSLFHGWLPFMLLFLVKRHGYDRRALPIWTMLAWALMATSYFFLPPAGAIFTNPNTPVNIDYVWGFSDSAPQTFMPQWAWLIMLFTCLPLAIYWPTHLTLKRLCKPADIR
jgi:hypothetical protein